MKLSIQVASTSQTVNVFIQDSSSTTGAGLTGLVFNSGSLTAYYALPKAAAVAITLVTLSAVTSAWSSGGFKEIDATNMPGWYRLDIPDAAIASGRFVSIHLKGASNMAPLPLEIELTGWNNQDAVRGGLTALPNAAASAVGGLPVAVDTSGRVDVLKINGTSQTARDVGASVLLSAGTGTGQLDFTSGVVKANLAQILGTALTETAGQIAAAFKKLFDVGSPVFTAASVNQTGDSFARIGFAGANLTSVTPLDSSGISTLLTRVPGTVQPQTGDAYARLGAPAGASHAADVAAVKTDTGNLRTDYTTARAAKLDNLSGDAYVRLGAPAGASVSADIAAVKVDTAAGATASALSTVATSIAAIPTATQNADALLKRDMSAVTGEAARSPLNALRFLRNKWSVALGTLTVTKEDDTTAAWTGTVSTDAAAVPITGNDPA